MSRCWTYETSIIIDEPLNDDLPFDEYLAYYSPDFQLHPDLFNPKIENYNSRAVSSNKS